MPTVQIVVKGKVQGVYYRATAKKAAIALNITGWVRNTPAGQVEMVATGEAAAIENFMVWCRTGPPEAIVTQVEITPCEHQSFTGFVIKPS